MKEKKKNSLDRIFWISFLIYIVCIVASDYYKNPRFELIAFIAVISWASSFSAATAGLIVSIYNLFKYLRNANKRDQNPND